MRISGYACRRYVGATFCIFLFKFNTKEISEIADYISLVFSHCILE